MDILKYGDDHQLIMCMHPHGIVPFHAWLWAAYADQYLYDKASGRALYGFGAAADAVGYVPGLRNIMGWLSAGSATYKVLKNGLMKVIVKYSYLLYISYTYCLINIYYHIHGISYRASHKLVTQLDANLATYIFYPEGWRRSSLPHLTVIVLYLKNVKDYVDCLLRQGRRWSHAMCSEELISSII